MSERVGVVDAVETSARRLRCPFCSATWCRCLECTARYVFGEAIACAMPVHASAVPLACRCGAIVDGPAVVRTPRGRRLALVAEPDRPPRGLMARLRGPDGARERIGSFVRAARRVARGVPHRETPTAA
jgi:hypothetical protein